MLWQKRTFSLPIHLTPTPSTIMKLPNFSSHGCGKIRPRPSQIGFGILDARWPFKGEGDDFRKTMVDAYKAMADNMPDNGLQIVMFTHTDASVWADMAQIFWGAGLQVMAAWYVATETTSELKKGGYVQGTVILVLRKRKNGELGYKDEIVQEVKVEVADQIDTMSGLNQSLKGHGRIENLFEDADLQMAGYAAALRVLTHYAKIDGDRHDERGAPAPRQGREEPRRRNHRLRGAGRQRAHGARRHARQACGKR